MKIKELTEKEFKSYIKDRKDLSFMQMPEIGNLRKKYGSEVKYLGLVKDDKILTASLFLITKTFMKKKTFYAPRGFLIDYNNKELLEKYVEELKKYARKNDALMIKIDPNVVYQMRDNKGNEIGSNLKNDDVIKKLKDLGFIHYGFNTDIVYTQSRWNMLLKLDRSYEEIYNDFSKSTRKNIEEVYKKGLEFRIGKKEDLDKIQPIFELTAERKNFNQRELEYFKNMFDALGDKMRIYIAFLDPKNYLEKSLSNLEEANKTLEEVEEKISREKVGNNLKKQEEIARNRVEKYKKELLEAEEFKKENPNGKDIGVLISVKSGEEYLTLYSGYLTEYSRFVTKYLLYNEHIKDAYKFNIPRINFYGITGVFDPQDKHYSMYEFKRGFGGEVQELIGEFTLPISKKYYLYMALRNIKRKLKKVD